MEPPKKRARRAPAPGAANDCFTCQELHMECDRRRPYCSQCLEHDKSCSGYKTALTWNIGVASRGKLRGLTLPIATSEAVSRRSVARGRKRWVVSNQLPELDAESAHLPPAVASQSADPSAKIGTRQYSFVNMDPKHSATTPKSPTPGARSRSAPQSDAHNSPRVRKRPRRHSSDSLRVQYADQIRGLQDSLLSASVLGLLNDHSFGLSIDSSPKAPLVVASEPYHGHFFSFPASGDLLNDNIYTEPPAMGWLRENCPSLNLDPSMANYSHHELSPTVAAPAVRADNILLNQESLDVYGFAANNAIWCGDSAADNSTRYLAQDQAVQVNALSYPDQLSLGISEPLSFQSGQTSNLRCLIDYYDRVVPPVPTTFNSRTHPYKAYILRLAAGNGALQYAIAALSANYMRQRCACARPNPSRQPFSDFFHDEFVRKSSSAHDMVDAGRNQMPSLCLGERLEREFYFKEVCSRALNEQLGEMNLRKDDSLRATILMLCLDHVCGMGLASLKRRFASVSKIVSVHGEIMTMNTKATTWLAIMFTWFDSMMLAGGRGKETFPAGSTMSPGVNEESWRLGTLAGCNGKLFQIISQLGQLNLARGDPPLIPADQAAHLGFGQILTPADNYSDYSDYIPNLNPADEGRPTPFANAETDPRSQFRSKRNEIRAQLEGWRWDPPAQYPTGAKPAAPLRQFNSDHVSESFRCAALLYIECLTSSRMAGMQPRVRTLVKRVLFHTSNVECDISLILPLFVAGLSDASEQICHLKGEGCLDLLDDSDLLRSVSALELAQHLWRGDDDDDGHGHGHGDAATVVERGFTEFDPSIRI